MPASCGTPSSHPCTESETIKQSNQASNQSINQSQQIYIVPHVVSESEAHVDGNKAEYLQLL